MPYQHYCFHNELDVSEFFGLRIVIDLQPRVHGAFYGT